MALRKLALASLSACFCGNAWAAGFAISGKSVSSLGSALSGSTVLAEDASVIYGNPAAMRSLEGRHFSALLHAIPVDFHFEDGGSSTTGNPTQQVDKVHVVPGLYYVNTLNDRVSYGLGIYSPFGLGLDYDDDWVGRYHSTHSTLRTINISPTLAFTASDKLNIGVGVDIQYAEAELEKAVDFGTICLLYGMSGCQDGRHTLRGNSWALGYSLGLTYDLSQATRLGMTFHSATRHDVKGDSEFSGVPTVLAGTFHNSDASLTMTLPESISLGIRHTISPQLEVMADYTWTRWSRYDEIVVKFSNGMSPVVEENNWNNNNRYAIGMNYRWQEDWLVRAGILYDETPIPDPEHRSPRVPDTDKLSVALGSKVALNNRLDLDLAVFYTLPVTTDINNTDSLGHNLKGSYEAQSTYLSLQLNWNI